MLTLLAAIQAFSKGSACESSTYLQILGLSPATNLFNISLSVIPPKRCSMMECCYIATNVAYIVLCVFVQAIPSPSVQIFRPKTILYQLFLVFPNYKCKGCNGCMLFSAACNTTLYSRAPMCTATQCLTGMVYT